MRGRQDWALKDISGQRFGRLVVISRAGATAERNSLWLCRCDCGGERRTSGKSLRAGTAQSCGCLQRERTIQAHTKHGQGCRSGKGPEYNIWQAMKRRCSAADDPAYHHYGGRGITVCDRWIESFENFRTDMGARPTSKHEVDRINNDGPYSPDNCRWATRKEQLRNTRRNRAVLRSDGVTFPTIIEAAEATGVHPSGIWATCRGVQNSAGGFGWVYNSSALLSALTPGGQDG